jgi:hypothetical protein
MIQKSNARLLKVTLANLLFCLAICAWLFSSEWKVAAQGPPAAFLGPIYYGSNPITNIFDHELPYLSLGVPDPNQCTRHNDGTDCNPNPPDGYGYDEHDGIDYDLNYEIVLAAATGTVDEAGWSNPTDHTRGLGLRVEIEHDNDYVTEYGHLSVIQVKTGDPITVVDPDNRYGIIGISGETGNSFGSHLHFGLIEPGGARVNPYGWDGLPVEDPWEDDPDGAPSFNVWVDEPSISTGQYDDGDAVFDPGVNNARMIIDNGSADFVANASYPPCSWSAMSNSSAYNQNYRRILADMPGGCPATWSIRKDAFTPAGEYDVFAHIPNATAASLGAEYTIQHNGKTSTAVVVQAAYLGNNDEHDAWAYLGRYDFAMNNLMVEFVRLSWQTIISDSGRYVLADAIKLAPAGDVAPPPQEYIYVSFAQSGTAGNVAYQDEDILSYNTSTSEWRMLFDGSDVGLSSRNVDAADFRNGSIYLSLDGNFGLYKAADIIRFTPTSLGDNTSGTMSMALEGARDGLTLLGENVDAIAFSTQGRYLRSTIDQATVPGKTFEDEDVFTDSPYEFFLDGSQVGLSDPSEDVDGLWVDTNGDIYLSTEGNFSVSGSSGDGADIIKCRPGSGQPNTCTFDPGLFWNASAHGLGSNTALVDAIFLGSLDGDCSSFANGGFEAQFLCWETINPDPSKALWQLSTINKHTGQFSAEGYVADLGADWYDTYLLSSPIAINDNYAYRFRFWGKSVPDNPGGSFQVNASVQWCSGESCQSEGFASVYHYSPLDWTEFDSGFICPPSLDVDSARVEFHLLFDTLSIEEGGGTAGSIFIDDVTWQQTTPPPSPCPTLNQDED